MSEYSVCLEYPNCDREHAGGTGGVPVHPPDGAHISGCDGPLIPDETKILLNHRLQKIIDDVAKAARVIIVNPADETTAKAAVEQSGFAGLFEVVASKFCPSNQVFVLPKDALEDHK